MDQNERIVLLEARIAQLEARIAALESWRYVPTLPYNPLAPGVIYQAPQWPVEPIVIC